MKRDPHLQVIMYRVDQHGAEVEGSRESIGWFHLGSEAVRAQGAQIRSLAQSDRARFRVVIRTDWTVVKNNKKGKAVNLVISLRKVLSARPIDLELYRRRPSFVYYLPWWVLALAAGFALLQALSGCAQTTSPPATSPATCAQACDRMSVQLQCGLNWSSDGRELGTPGGESILKSSPGQAIPAAACEQSCSLHYTQDTRTCMAGARSCSDVADCIGGQ